MSTNRTLLQSVTKIGKMTEMKYIDNSLQKSQTLHEKNRNKSAGIVFQLTSWC